MVEYTKINSKLSNLQLKGIVRAGEGIKKNL